VVIYQWGRRLAELTFILVLDLDLVGAGAGAGTGFLGGWRGGGGQLSLLRKALTSEDCSSILATDIIATGLEMLPETRDGSMDYL